jgi:hypothetical protein
MCEYQLVKDHYILPTPAGAYAAVTHQSGNAVHRLLCSLLRQQTTPLLTQQALEEWTGLGKRDAQEVLYRAQTHRWIEGFSQPRQPLRDTLDELLPALLPVLAESGQVLLANDHGSHLASTGFTAEMRAELAGLSTDLAPLESRHGSALQRNLGCDCRAWSLVDAAGNSQLGLWPLFINDHRFVLILQGQPRFNQPAFTELIWALSTQYSERLKHY